MRHARYPESNGTPGADIDPRHWRVSANTAWILNGDGDPVLGPFTTRRHMGALLSEQVLAALQAAYAAGKGTHDHE